MVLGQIKNVFPVAEVREKGHHRQIDQKDIAIEFIEKREGNGPPDSWKRDPADIDPGIYFKRGFYLTGPMDHLMAFCGKTGEVIQDHLVSAPVTD